MFLRYIKIIQANFNGFLLIFFILLIRSTEQKQKQFELKLQKSQNSIVHSKNICPPHPHLSLLQYPMNCALFYCECDILVSQHLTWVVYKRYFSFGSFETYFFACAIWKIMCYNNLSTFPARNRFFRLATFTEKLLIIIKSSMKGMQ